MKKLAVSLIATGMLVGLGIVLGQEDQSHDVVVTLPQLLSIRLVDTTAATPLAAVTPAGAVVFDLGSETADSFDPTGTYGASAANWNDVIVFANTDGWVVTVGLTNSTSLLGLGLFDWSKVSVAGMFNLVEDAVVASALVPTGGWTSLGFGPEAFALSLDGTEVADTYRVTVTYTIVGPL